MFHYYLCRIAITVLGWIVLLLPYTILAQTVEPATPRENIQKYKELEESPIWRLPLGPVHISEMIQMGQDTLFLGLKTNEKNLPSQECLMINLTTGKPIWQYPFKSKTDYNLFSASDDILILIGETEGTKVLTALDKNNGTSLWQLQEKDMQDRFHAIPGNNMILLDRRKDKGAEILALSMESGDIKWSQNYPVEGGKTIPGLFQEGPLLFHFFSGLNRISIENGQTLWSRPDLIIGLNDPPPQVLHDTLFLSIHDHVLALDVDDGQTLWRQSSGLFTTNLYPLEEILLVRGELPKQDASGNYAFHLGHTWALDEKVNNYVSRYRDDRTGAFILLAYIPNADSPIKVYEMMEEALKNLSKGNPKPLQTKNAGDNPLQVQWQYFEGKLEDQKDKLNYKSVLGAIWDPDQKKAAGFMGFCGAEQWPVSEEDILKSFQTFEFTKSVSVADSWKQRAQNLNSDNFKITAYNKRSGMELWNFSTPDPTLSNFLETDETVFFGTSTDLYAIDKISGRLIFKTSVSSNDANYPVHIMYDGEKIFFIGELVVAAVDPASGKEIYNHGITPIDFNVSVAGLDNAIPIYTEKVQAISSAEPPAVMNISNFHSAERMRYQNLANKYAQQSRSYYSRGDNIGYEISEIRREHADNMAKFEANMAFAWSVIELGQVIAQILVTRAILNYYQDLLSQQVLFRKSVISSYTMAEIGEYVYRPHRKLSTMGSDDFTTLTIVHLPSGQRRTTVLSPTYLNYGLWNLVDFDKGIVYHHGIGLDPDFYTISDRMNLGAEGRVQTINTYLIATPVRIPR